MSAHAANKETTVLGPFIVEEYKPGASVLLKRNANYWKKDAQGRQLPYLDAIRLDIQPIAIRSTALPARRTRPDQFHRCGIFRRLAASSPAVVHDAGASLDSEFMWFNQVANSPIPAYKRNWFPVDHFSASHVRRHQP